MVVLTGFLFDELGPDVVLGAVRHAASHGSSIFFDPGPRAWTLPRPVLKAMVRQSHAVFMTQVSAEGGMQDRLCG